MLSKHFLVWYIKLQLVSNLHVMPMLCKGVVRRSGEICKMRLKGAMHLLLISLQMLASNNT